MPPLPSRDPRLVLNVTGLDALTAGYRADKATGTVYAGAEGRIKRWAVDADALTAVPVHAVDDTAHSPVRSAAFEPAHRGETNRSSEPKPVHYSRVMAQDQVHDLAAALYAALYGELESLAHAVPPSPSSVPLAARRPE